MDQTNGETDGETYGDDRTEPEDASSPSDSGRIVLLTRHGETDWNSEGRWQGHTDIALSDRGREQSRALAARLRDMQQPIVRIRCSDLQRARETAEIVAQTLGVTDLMIDPRLRERGFGVFEGLTREECSARFPELWASYEQDRKILPPGGEPHDQVITRLSQALQSALSPPPEPQGALLVVGHGGALRVLLSSIFGRPFPPISNAALLRLHFRGQRYEDLEDLGPG